MTKTANMIENRKAYLEELGHNGELNGDLFMFALGEWSFLNELAECEREDAATTVSLDNTVHKMAHESICHENQIKKALRKVVKLTEAIENMKYDCDGEVYDELCSIIDVLSK